MEAQSAQTPSIRRKLRAEDIFKAPNRNVLQSNSSHSIDSGERRRT